MLLSVTRRFLLLLAAALLLPLAPLAAAADERPAARGFLWEATRGAQRVLLLGSIHVGRAEFAAFESARLPHLMRAEVIAFEANVFDAQSVVAATQRWAMYPADGPGLEAQVDPALLQRIERIVARTGGNLPVCCRMRPWMLANTLVVLDAIDAGFSPAYGSEARLFDLAQSMRRPIVEIEGLDAQLRLFGEAPADVQVDYLRHAVESIENGASRREIERLVGAWARGDAAVLEQLAAEMAHSEIGARRFVAERIVRGRHPRMLAAIEGYAADARLHLVVIGALHFFGPDGLLQALRSRGFAVVPLS